ncbi:DNA translocase FtsK [Sphingobium sp. V4]|nr:DNA translocase FtsK [Sphingobium sp. V4]WIW89922.1 DNA translocase FtsK [Sphingobium sp. V4]
MYEGHDGRPEPSRPAPAPTADDAERFTAALSLVVDHQNASTSWLQRQMRIGYNSAQRLIEELERKGVVGPPNHIGKRDVLISAGGQPAIAIATA